METKVAIGGGTIYINNQDGTLTKISDVKTIEFTEQMLIEKPSFDKSFLCESSVFLKVDSIFLNKMKSKKWKIRKAKRPYRYERSK